MTRLIVNADDFGMTPGINRAVADLAVAGALTSATLMANGPAYDDAVALARELPALSVGCHVVLVDGTPLSSAEDVRTLTEADGQFRSSLSSFALALLARRIAAPAIEQEAIAQIRTLQASGIRVHHVDTHKHTHIFPAVLLPILRAMKQCGVPAIRNPFEPVWSAKYAKDSSSRRAQVSLLRRMYEPAFLRLCRENGIVTTDGSLGIAATGSLEGTTLRAMIAHLPKGDWELVCHPGLVDSALATMRTRLRASREIERAALLQVIPSAVQAGACVLTDFRRLAMRSTAESS